MYSERVGHPGHWSSALSMALIGGLPALLGGLALLVDLEDADVRQVLVR